MTTISDSLGASSTYNPTAASQLLPTETSPPHASDQISSLDPQVQREIVGVELYVKYGLAGLVGAVPFIASKVGEEILKVSIFATKIVRDVTHQLSRVITTHDFDDTVVQLVEYIFRASFGIPAVIGGSLLVGGAVAFSMTQALIWGRDLIEHPREERVNTKLARYGAGDKPLEDYQKLLFAFFTPVIGSTDNPGPNEQLWFSPIDPYISVALEELQDFEAT